MEKTCSEDAGFGKPSRTSIFDYIGVPSLQRWVNNKQFDGGASTTDEKELRDFYKRLLNFTINSSALASNYEDIHQYNRDNTENYNDKVLSFARWSDDEQLIVISNFDSEHGQEFELNIPEGIIQSWALENQNYKMHDALYNSYSSEISVENGKGRINIKLDPLQSFILKLKK